MAASPAKKNAVRSKSPAAQKSASKSAAGKGEALLRAGLKVLGEARDRQTRVVETLLGIPAAAAAKTPLRTPAAKTALDSLGDSLGFRKLEDVFDQRIAAALERLGVPSAEEFAALREEVRLLRAERAAAAEAPAVAKSRKR